MKIIYQIIIKLALVVVIILFALSNYKYISFEKGISKTYFNDMSVRNILQTVSGVKSVQYYKKTIPPIATPTFGPRPSNYQSYDYIYKVYIVTSEDAYLLDATQDDIDAFKVLGVFSSKLKPELIKPIPFYYEIIIGLIIIVIPFGLKKQKKGA